MQQCCFDGIVQFSLWIKPVSGRISLLWKNACLVHHKYLVTVCELTISGKTILPLCRLSQLCIIKTSYNLLVQWFCLSCFSCACVWVCVCEGGGGGGGRGGQKDKRRYSRLRLWTCWPVDWRAHCHFLYSSWPLRHKQRWSVAVLRLHRWHVTPVGDKLTSATSCWIYTTVLESGSRPFLAFDLNHHWLTHFAFGIYCARSHQELSSIPWQQQFSLAVDWPPNTCTFKDSHVNTTGCSTGQARNYMTPSDAWRWCNSLPDPTETHYTCCSHVTVPETIWHHQMLGGDVTVYLIQQKLIIHAAVMSLCLRQWLSESGS